MYSMLKIFRDGVFPVSKVKKTKKCSYFTMRVPQAGLSS